MSIKGRKIWVPDQEYMKAVTEKAASIFKGVAGFTATALLFNLSAATEELPFGHTAALIVGQLVKHADDVGANNKYVREAAQQAEFVGHVISTLLDAEFPSNTPVFERTIEALCHLRDVAEKWDKKSWKQKGFGISFSTFQSTAAKYNHLFKLQLAEVELCRKHLMDEVNADTYAAIDSLKAECANRDEELLSTLQEADAATREGLKSQDESLEVIKSKLDDAHQTILDAEATLSEKLDAFEDQLQDALGGLNEESVAKAVTQAVVATHDELEQHFGAALEAQTGELTSALAEGVTAVKEDAAANKNALLEQMHNGMQVLAIQMKKDGRASAEAASVATQQVTAEETQKVIEQVRQSEANMMDGITGGMAHIEAQLSALVESSTSAGEPQSSADLAVALEPMLEDQATKIMVQMKTNRKEDRKLILKKLHRASVELAKNNAALAVAKDKILNAIQALDGKITNKLDGIQQCLAVMAAHPNATPAEVKAMIDAAVATQQSLGSAERQAMMQQLQDAAAQHATANAVTSDEHKSAILDAIAAATDPAAITMAHIASLEAKVEELQLKVQELNGLVVNAGNAGTVSSRCNPEFKGLAKRIKYGGEKSASWEANSAKSLYGYYNLVEGNVYQHEGHKAGWIYYGTYHYDVSKYGWHAGYTGSKDTNNGSCNGKSDKKYASSKPTEGPCGPWGLWSSETGWVKAYVELAD